MSPLMHSSGARRRRRSDPSPQDPEFKQFADAADIAVDRRRRSLKSSITVEWLRARGLHLPREGNAQAPGGRTHLTRMKRSDESIALEKSATGFPNGAIGHGTEDAQ